MIDKRDLELARTVDLPAFLESELGLAPCFKEGPGRFYNSPLRKENVSSLHVSYRDGVWVWYDHGSAERRGGDAIELLRKLGHSFPEAVERLAKFNGGCHGISARKASPCGHDIAWKDKSLEGKSERIGYAREFYERLPESGYAVKKYFSSRGLNYHPEIGCRVFVDFKGSTKYLVFPVPTPLSITGVELREMVPLDKETAPGFKKKRKSYGAKSLWVLRRDPKRILITESIMDGLAGETALNESEITLVSLNGVGQALMIDGFLKEFQPEEALLALDRDGPGREAEAIVRKLLFKHSVKVSSPELSGKDLLREHLFKRLYAPEFRKDAERGLQDGKA